MRHRRHLRRGGVWVLSAAAAACALAFIISGWWTVAAQTPPCDVSLNRGDFMILRNPPGVRRDGYAWISRRIAPPSLRPRVQFWWIFSGEAPNGGTVVFIPLWLPASVLVPAAALAWRVDRRARRREVPWLCPRCGYDRRGLARRGGVACPECGLADA